jgi:hypothetical protein
MLIDLLVVSRAVQIGASMLLVGIFTFDFFVLSAAGRRVMGELRPVKRCLLSLAFWSLAAAFFSG